MTASSDWQQLVADKQQQLAKDFPPEWRLKTELLSQYSSIGQNLIDSDVLHHVDFFSAEELSLTQEHTASSLVQQLREGKLSSETLTTAFAKRAAIAQQLTSCLTETMFREALERAKSLDRHLKEHGTVVGPLHGLPVSIKDSFRVKGKQATVGYVEFLKHAPEETESALVTLLLDLGAVLYVKTNIPQTMMTGDSDNNIFGRTLNPHKTSLTAGGSSGGEGALVAFRGSPLGVGTDIAGSIRIPSLCCGVYGFKPTADRVPFGGQVSGAMEGLPGIHPSAGPLANSVEDLDLFMTTVMGAETWKYDVTAVGSRWNPSPQPTGETKLTLGVLEEHPLFPLHPPVRRALDSAIEALEKKGHTIVRISQEGGRDIAYGNRLAFEYFVYAPHTDHIVASGEPPVASVQKMAHPMFTGPMPVPMESEPYEKIDALQTARNDYIDAWRKTWIEHKLDGIISPGAQNTAVPYDTFGWPPYTCVWNLLDYPACMIPYSKASSTLDPDPFSTADDVQPNYEPNAVDGAPCAIQVIAPYFQDEKCLAISRIIDADIR